MTKPKTLSPLKNRKVKNWAGNIEFTPHEIISPDSTEAVQLAIREARVLRPMGARHSWTELIPTSGTLLSLGRLQGLISVDSATKTVQAYAGTRLSDFSAAAFAVGLSLRNQGDIHTQTLAGALSTGTHGTGITLQSMSNQLVDFKMVLASGDVLTLSEVTDRDLFNACRVAFGTCGVITEAKLQLVPAYRLKVSTAPEEMNVALERMGERLHKHRHLELFYFPLGDWAIVKTMDPTNEEPTPSTPLEKFSKRFNDHVLENWLYEKFNQFAGVTGKYLATDALLKKFVTARTDIGWAHEIFPSERNVRFMEMEYSVPLDCFTEVFSELKAMIRARNFQTLFPIEIRFVKGDSIWLSPASGRDSVYFALHNYISQDFRPYFEAAQEIFQKYQGRPHWGKWHSAGAEYLATVYPKWNAFLEVRQKLDPGGHFLNESLKGLLRPVHERSIAQWSKVR
ncbi:MAG: FAD-binding protein [Methylotenera sp.]|nr:FAD-binding protein [Oligoflexia bacterium]